MPVAFACSCGKKYSAPDEAAGKQTKCKACGATIRIPSRKPVSSSQSPAVVKKVAAPPRPKPPELDFADSGPAKPKEEDLFQGPPPPENGGSGAQLLGPAAALYGTATAQEKKPGIAALVPWLVVLGLVIVAAGAIKFLVFK